MAKQYQVNLMVRFVNRVMMRLNKWGIARCRVSLVLNR